MNLRFVSRAASVALLVSVVAARADVLLHSFEVLYNDSNVPDPLGTRPDGFHFNGGGTTVSQDTIGATQGTKSMKFTQVSAATFTAAITELGAPFPVLFDPGTYAISFDYTVAPGDEFTGGFANLGFKAFGENSSQIPGDPQTPAHSEQQVKVPAGTYRIIIPLIANFDPYTFDGDVSFASIMDAVPDPANQMIPTSWEFYVNKGPTATIPTNGALTAYFDNVQAVTGGTSTWKTNTDGNWSDAGKWAGFPTAVPSGINTVAVFGLPILEARTVTVDAPQTVGTLYFNNPNGYTIAGTSALTMDVSSGQALITTVAGNHVVSAPLVLNDDTQVNVPASTGVLTLSGAITATGRTISKTGAGRADVSNINVAGIDVQAGTMKLLTGSGTSRTNTLTIAGGSTPTAKLDIANNALVINNGAGQQPTIAAQVRSAYAGGAWNGNGITSSNADATNFSVGYAQASDLTTVPAIFGSVGANAMLVRYTRYGDADLSGTVGLDDFNRLASNFNGSGKFWSEGNFNHDAAGNVNLDDFNLLAGNFNLSAAGPEVTPEDWAALAAAIPEPSALLSGVVALAATRLRCRRTHTW